MRRFLAPKYDPKSIASSFKFYDFKCDGVIDKSELQQYYKSDVIVDAIFNRFDKNKDGVISYSEFYRELSKIEDGAATLQRYLEEYPLTINPSQYQNRIHQTINTSEEDIRSFLSQYKQSIVEAHKYVKQMIAKELADKALNLIGQHKHKDAVCYLDIALDLDPTNNYRLLREEVQAKIAELEGLSEHEIQLRVEKKINEIKEDIIHAEHQEKQTRSQEEKEMIARQLEVLRNMEVRLQEQIRVNSEHQQKLQEREACVQQREQLLKEQTEHIERLLEELAQTSSSLDSSVQNQVLAIEKGDKDINAARTRFESLQKAAKGAQQALVSEERRQRERVEWLQKQMDLYKLKGMSPEQKTFRNYLKDVKRLSRVRHHMEHTPHPLRCFISYAWETDPDANKQLQKRLQILKEDLQLAGMEVMLDIRDMKYDMKKFMVDNINKAHKLLLICTPRLQERAADPIKNNLQLELETALAKEQCIPEFITPLLFSGSFSTSMPPQISHLLSLSLTPDEDYYSAMASLAPMGLIPMLMGLERNKDYGRIYERMAAELEDYEKSKL